MPRTKDTYLKKLALHRCERSDVILYLTSRDGIKVSPRLNALKQKLLESNLLDPTKIYFTTFQEKYIAIGHPQNAVSFKHHDENQTVEQFVFDTALHQEAVNYFLEMTEATSVFNKLPREESFPSRLAESFNKLYWSREKLKEKDSNFRNIYIRLKITDTLPAVNKKSVGPAKRKKPASEGDTEPSPLTKRLSLQAPKRESKEEKTDSDTEEDNVDLPAYVTLWNHPDKQNIGFFFKIEEGRKPETLKIWLKTQFWNGNLDKVPLYFIGKNHCLFILHPDNKGVFPIDPVKQKVALDYFLSETKLIPKPANPDDMPLSPFTQEQNKKRLGQFFGASSQPASLFDFTDLSEDDIPPLVSAASAPNSSQMGNLPSPLDSSVSPDLLGHSTSPLVGHFERSNIFIGGNPPPSDSPISAVQLPDAVKEKSPVDDKTETPKPQQSGLITLSSASLYPSSRTERAGYASSSNSRPRFAGEQHDAISSGDLRSLGVFANIAIVPASGLPSTSSVDDPSSSQSENASEQRDLAGCSMPRALNKTSKGLSRVSVFGQTRAQISLIHPITSTPSLTAAHDVSGASSLSGPAASAALSTNYSGIRGLLAEAKSRQVALEEKESKLRERERALLKKIDDDLNRREAELQQREQEVQAEENRFAPFASLPSGLPAQTSSLGLLSSSGSFSSSSLPTTTGGAKLNESFSPRSGHR